MVFLKVKFLALLLTDKNHHEFEFKKKFNKYFRILQIRKICTVLKFGKFLVQYIYHTVLKIFSFL